MSIKRITISVSEDVASNIKKAAGKTAVSAWVADVITEHLNDTELQRQWQIERVFSPEITVEKRNELTKGWKTAVKASLSIA